MLGETKMSLGFVVIFLLATEASSSGIQFKLGRGNGDKLDKLEICPDVGKKDLPWIVGFDGFKFVGRNIIMNVSITVKRTVNTHKIGTRMVTKRCKFMDNLDSCEAMPPVSSTNWCEIVTGTAHMSKFVQNYFSNFKPSLTCPLKKGIYRATNLSYDISMISLFKSESYYWSHRFETIDLEKNQYLSCVVVETIIRQKV